MSSSLFTEIVVHTLLWTPRHNNIVCVGEGGCLGGILRGLFVLLSLLCDLCLCLSLNGRGVFEWRLLYSLYPPISVRFWVGWECLNVFAVECRFHTRQFDAMRLRLSRRMLRESERKRERYPIMFDGK